MLDLPDGVDPNTLYRGVIKGIDRQRENDDEAMQPEIMSESERRLYFERRRVRQQMAERFRIRTFYSD